ncbi:MAG: NADH-specific enoyl-ACP reductase [Acidobacteria bacterium]|nr:MAG: NADH-specific enoyl-ACP reductase [Acidobacteriota bacterium]
MLLEDRKGLILGVANKRSIAWAIAQSTAREGARLAFTFQGERLEENVRELAATLPGSQVYPCDVASDAQIESLFEALRKDFGQLDFLVHCIAFANREDLESDFVKTSREGFRLAQDISAYSLIGLTRPALSLFPKDGGSILALTYLGSQRAIPRYNIMGVAKASLEASIRYLASDLGPHNIRVNGISAGPISTLAARGIPGFTSILDHYREKAPLRRNIEAAEVGDAATFLLSPLARGITGEILFVDAGYHVAGI